MGSKYRSKDRIYFKNVRPIASVRNKELEAYRERLASADNTVLFDQEALKILLDEMICVNPKLVNQVRDQLNKMDYAQSRKDPEQLISQLERFHEPHVRDKSDDPVVSQAISFVAREFAGYCLRPLSYDSDSDIEAAIPKKSTHAGYTGVITRKPKKGMHLLGINRKWSRWLSFNLKRGSIGRLILPGVRTQNSTPYDVHGKLKPKEKLPPLSKTRLVSMVDLFVIILELMFQVPFQRVIEHKSWYAGGKDYAELESIVHSLSEHYNWLVIDYSSYDQTIPGWLIQAVFDRIIKPAFELTEEQSVIFDEMVKAFIHKDFLSPDGRIIHADDGNPSGSMWTQIIGTICNRVMIYAYCISRRVGLHGMTIMGDDNLISTYDTIDTSDLAHYLGVMFGVDINPKKCCDSRQMPYPEFLSTVWLPGGRWRAPESLITKLLYPERFRDYPSGKCSAAGVVFSYILAYPLGMKELINIPAFLDKYGLEGSYWLAEEMVNGKNKERLRYKLLLSTTELSGDLDERARLLLLKAKSRIGNAA